MERFKLHIVRRCHLFHRRSSDSAYHGLDSLIALCPRNDGIKSDDYEDCSDAKFSEPDHQVCPVGLPAISGATASTRSGARTYGSLKVWRLGTAEDSGDWVLPRSYDVFHPNVFGVLHVIPRLKRIEWRSRNVAFPDVSGSGQKHSV